MTQRREHGTSTLEVAGIIPLVFVVILLLVQAALALYTIGTAQTAARQGARAWSQGHDPEQVVRDSVPSWIDVTTTRFGPGKGVRAELDVPGVVPFFDLTVDREVVMP